MRGTRLGCSQCSWRGGGGPAGVLDAPGRFVAIDVAVDLRGPVTGRRREVGQFPDLSGLVEAVAPSSERGTEVWVAHDCGVTDAVDGLDRVDHSHRVQSPPSAVGVDAGIELQVQVTVRVPGPGGVVPDHDGRELLDRHLYLPTPRPHPRGRAASDVGDDLTSGAVHRRLMRPRDHRVQSGGDRPGLGSVDHDLHPTMHACSPPRPLLVTARHRPLERRSARSTGRTDYEPS